MSVERARTIGERKSNLSGRMMASLKTASGGRSEVYLPLSLLLLVSPRSFLAFRSRSMGG